DVFLFSTGQSGTAPGALDRILDWTAGADRLHFIGLADATRTTYLELTAADYGAAKILADSQIAAGNNYVAVQVGGDVILFVDSASNNGAADDAVMLVGRTLADIDYANIVS
ncbi:MAG: hemolysin-type calcium-binding region protein, partial [Phenylobacterium sp.]|nr:hemolysin-type calcium-binding region protein [Phenylobacterium sp.]